MTQRQTDRHRDLSFCYYYVICISNSCVSKDYVSNNYISNNYVSNCKLLQKQLCQ